MKFSTILVSCSLLLPAASWGQSVPKCGAEWPLDSPATAALEAQVQARMSTVLASRGGGGCAGTFRIPIVFHVIDHDGDPFGPSVTDANLQDQVDYLNDEFRDNLDGMGDQACIEFCLAQNTPDGLPWTAYMSATAGITRWRNTAASLGNDVSAAEGIELASLVLFDPARYLNVWIVDEVGGDGPGGIGGFGTFPGSSGAVDGIVIEHTAITGGSVMGELLIHEIGHYLGLLHLWGLAADGFGSCAPEPGMSCGTLNDRVCDTGLAVGNNLDADPVTCADMNTTNCAGPETVENYMDYLPETCAKVFTAGQVVRMLSLFPDWRATLISPSNHIITGIAGPSGCTTPELIGDTEVFSNGTQFCTGTGSGVFTGVLAVDSWTFTIEDPNAVITTISGTGVPNSGSVTFSTAGAWTITLTVENTVTSPLGGPLSSAQPLTVYVSDCGPIDPSQAQWYFGAYCALDFSSGVPIAMPNSAMHTEDGAAVSCNAVSGALEFYGSNHQVYNDLHQPLMMPDFGDNTYSVQGALFVPDPGDPDQRYMFRTGSMVVEPLHYSLLDATTGLLVPGFEHEVADASSPVNTTQHLSAVPDCGNTGFWIVTHDLPPGGGSDLLSYHLTASGIDPTEVVSPAFATAMGQGRGYIEFNREGDLAAIVGAGTCHLYTFDRASGEFAHLLDVAPGTATMDGVAFSPSGDFLYTQQYSSLVQHDLRDLDLCTATAPPFNTTPFDEFVPASSLQLGPDGKIYMSNYLRDELSVINYPDAWNTGANEYGFNWRSVSIEVPGGVNETCLIGLPNMIDAHPAPVVHDFEWCGIDCENVTFELRGCGSVIEWDLDCNSSIDATGTTFSHAFTTPGTYCVSITVDGGPPITHTIDVDIADAPDIVPAVVCHGVATTFSATNTTGMDHVWSLTGTGTAVSGLTDPTVDINWTGTGTLTLEVTDAIGCTNDATVSIAPVTYTANAGPDVTVCVGESVVLGDLGSASNCSWDPSTELNLTSPCAPVFTSTTAGTYVLTVTAEDANGCIDADDVTVTVEDVSCDPFTLTKWATPDNTYAGAPVLFSIQACNTTASDATVDIGDELPADFHLIDPLTNPYWPPAPVDLDAGECITIEYLGYFTTLGEHENTATLEHTLSSTDLSASATVDVMVGCPMIVLGSGECDGTVDLCLGMHTDLTDVTEVSLYFLYPEYLEPPAAGDLLAASAISSPFITEMQTATISAPIHPISFPAGYSAVRVTVTFSPGVSPSPPYSFFCVPFTVGPDGVPPGVNSATLYASSTAPSDLGLNQTTGIMGGSPFGFWTQAYQIIFTGCPDIVPPVADFQVRNFCGGEVHVDALLTDPAAVHIWTWGDERTTPVNGAPNYTWRYYDPVTLNQTPSVTIPPAPPGTYTITHTVVLNGVSSTSTRTVTLFDCCEAAVSIPDGTHSSSIGVGLSTTTVDIQGEFIVDNYFTMDHLIVTMEPGSRIVVRSGQLLDLNNVHVSACTQMWDGIVVESNAVLNNWYSDLADARYAIQAQDGSYVNAYSTVYDRNYVSILVPDNGGIPQTPVINVGYCDFTCTDDLKPAYPGQTPAPGNISYAGVLAYDDAMLDLSYNGGGGPPVNFIGLSNGVRAIRCNVVVDNCVFDNIHGDGSYTGVDQNGTALHATGDGSDDYFTLEQFGFGMTGAASFNDCTYGICTDHMEIRSEANNMDDMNMGYRIAYSGDRGIDIISNDLRTSGTAIDLRFNDGCTHAVVANNVILFGGPVIKEASGIRVEENNGSNRRCRIHNNTITFRPDASNARYGINMRAVSDYQVTENVLLMVDNERNYAGIRTDGCDDLRVSCNNVQGAFADYKKKADQAAIINVMGANSVFACNNVDGTTNGFYFSGAAYGTDLRGNDINHHVYGLYLDKVGIIGTQTLKGNL